MFETNVTVAGNLATHISRHRLSDGGHVVHFRVASTERRYDRATGSWQDGDSLYISVTCWRQLADNVHQSLTIGDPVVVLGRLSTRQYDDKEGRRQSVIEMDALAVGPDLNRCTAQVARTRRDGAGPAPGMPAAAPADPAEAGEGMEPEARGLTAGDSPDGAAGAQTYGPGSESAERGQRWRLRDPQPSPSRTGEGPLGPRDVAEAGVGA